MNLRQKIEVLLLSLLTFFAFSSYHESSGGTGWLQWLTVVAILIFLIIFDFSFTKESMFVFDPDADNWRRKVVRTLHCCAWCFFICCCYCMANISTVLNTVVAWSYDMKCQIECARTTKMASR